MADKKNTTPHDLDAAHTRASAALQMQIDETQLAVATARQALDDVRAKLQELQAAQVNASFAYDAARSRL